MNPVQMVAKFYDVRDSLRAALGAERYEATAAPWRDQIRKHGDKWFEFALSIGKRAMKDGESHLCGLILAVVADLADEEDRGVLPHQTGAN